MLSCLLHFPSHAPLLKSALLSTHHRSCSPSWCVFDTNVACLFSTPSINYAQEISGLTCKTCTQSSNAQCSTSALKSLLKVSGDDGLCRDSVTPLPLYQPIPLVALGRHSCRAQPATEDCCSHWTHPGVMWGRQYPVCIACSTEPVWAGEGRVLQRRVPGHPLQWPAQPPGVPGLHTDSPRWRQ
jgi:hypothetical protein